MSRFLLEYWRDEHFHAHTYLRVGGVSPILEDASKDRREHAQPASLFRGIKRAGLIIILFMNIL
jgi:hypothetical protein